MKFGTFNITDFKLKGEVGVRCKIRLIAYAEAVNNQTKTVDVKTLLQIAKANGKEIEGVTKDQLELMEKAFKLPKIKDYFNTIMEVEATLGTLPDGEERDRLQAKKENLVKSLDTMLISGVLFNSEEQEVKKFFNQKVKSEEDTFELRIEITRLFLESAKFAQEVIDDLIKTEYTDSIFEEIVQGIVSEPENKLDQDFFTFTQSSPSSPKTEAITVNPSS